MKNLLSLSVNGTDIFSASDGVSSYGALPSGVKESLFCEFTFDSSWEEYEIKAVFLGGDVTRLVPLKYPHDRVAIPGACLTQPGTLQIGAVGIHDERIFATALFSVGVCQGASDAEPGGEEKYSFLKLLEEKEDCGICYTKAESDVLLADKEDKNVYTLLEKVTTVKANAVQVISKTFTEPLRALRIVFVQGATNDVNYSMKLTATDENLRNLILPDLTGLHGTVETHGYMELKPVYGYWEGEEAMTTSWGSGYSAIKYTAPYLIQKYPASKLMMMRLQVNGDGRMFTDGEIQIWGVKA